MLQPLWISASIKMTYISGIKIIYNNTFVYKTDFPSMRRHRKLGHLHLFHTVLHVKLICTFRPAWKSDARNKWTPFEKNINLWMLCDSFFVTVSFRMCPLQLYSHVIQNSSVWIFVCLLRIGHILHEIVINP
jgi:hypothetical protein